MLRRLRRVFGLLVDAAEVTLRLGIVTVRLAWSGVLALVDFAAARRRLAGGVLHCPIGHEIATEGATYECTACGYRYGGKGASIWLCGNVECKAVTPYVDCSTCSLSVRNPYRWGRP